MCQRLAVLSLLWAALGSAADRGPFTLEQVLSSAFPSELVAAPAGGKVAWVLNARGARNIWAAGPPDYQGRPVTSYSADDGQEILDLTWTPDARAIVYVRGGPANRSGEYPNPTSDPRGAEQQVWVVPATGGEPARLGEGHSLAVDPKGGRVAFLRKGQVWWAPLNASSKAEQLLHTRGEAGSLRWSPDGSKLAFVSNRQDHSFIGVYDLAAKALGYLDPSVDRDSSPAWSPDGKSVAFLRIPTSRERALFGPRRTAEPWSIRIADAAEGRGRQVWQALRDTGSVFWPMAAENQLLWGAGDRLVFPWERDGWNHLYSVSVRGERATLLTSGPFEVEHVSLAPGGRHVLYSSNEGDIDRRHIWKVPAEGGRAAAVTSGNGIEWDPVPTSDGEAVAFLRSDARRPARAAILVGSAPARDLAPAAIPADFPESSLVEPQPVLFTAADGLQIHGQLFLPPKSPPGGAPGARNPAVIFFHGGSRRQMLLGWHYRGYYHNAYAMNQYLVSRGFVVLAVNYRSGIGYGMEFREALNYGARGASEFHDVLGAGLYLRSRPDVDPKRIGLWGGSYGGYLTALGLARASDLFAAGVDLHGVHDWNVEIRNWVPTYDPDAQREAARVAYESSPVAYLKTWRSPVLLIQGDDDRNVQFSQTVSLAGELRKLGVECEQLVFPDEAHDFLIHRRWLQAYHAAADFFERKLGK